ncbi:MAG: IPT/TIG domain-containing protein, partial [Bryobacteraceae bacterium]
FMPILFASPGQINFQLPDAIALGAQTLTIEPQGQPNVQSNVNVARNAPGLFQQAIDGQAFALAYHADGSAITATAPAQVGETITIYGTGFGPTSPARLEGYALPASPVYNIVDAVTVTAGGVTAPATAAFALAGSVGIDVAQFAITDPATSGTNASVSLTINGQSSNTVLVPVQ